MSTKHHCPTCKDNSFVEIEEKSTAMFCGIVGITDLKNVIVNQGECLCAFCRVPIYTEK